MDDRLSAAIAMLVGGAVAAIGTAEFLVAGFAPPPFDPFVTGLLVVGTGALLLLSGVLAFREALDHLALRAATAVGVLTLILAVLQPRSLRFGGVFWLALVSAGLVAAGAYRTVSIAW
ncbi:MAG: hypothetical protein ACI8UR_001194 [Natronomonas sp.]|jgi:hypothetical protein|uniref:hypothetical protein n=1 Tax=Natronomonas sp. TaxID=2184060 RepID=UPI0039899606